MLGRAGPLRHKQIKKWPLLFSSSLIGWIDRHINWMLQFRTKSTTESHGEVPATLLGFCCIPGIVLGARDTREKKVDKYPCLAELIAH